MQNTKFLHVPNYLQMFPEEYAFLKEEIGVLVENALVGRNTLIGKGEDWSKNTLYNLYDLSQQYSTKDLCEAIKAAGLEDYPVVIVAAGPSLEDNIDALKAYQDRAVIIGINRSIPILEAHGIKSHINFLIDPGINPEQVGGPLMRQIPLVTVTSACAGFHQLHEGKRFYFAGDQFAFQLMQQVGHPLTEIDGGGSVATTAFVVAMNMGFKKMILIGQDLAFKDGQQYSMQSVNAQWSFVEEAKADGSSSKEGYFLVDGNNGNKVVTKYDYDYFRLWYERQIERNPQLHVINATEGGALIRGTAVMTLAEALERECPANPAGISEIIDKVKPIFGEEKRGYIEFLDAIELHMPELLDELKKGQELYKKLEALVRNNGYNHPKYSKYVKEVSRLNSKLEEDLGIMFLEQFDASGRYDVLDALSEKTGDEHSEIKLIVEQGLKSIENYMESAKRWREALDEVKEMLREKGTIE